MDLKMIIAFFISCIPPAIVTFLTYGNNDWMPVLFSATFVLLCVTIAALSLKWKRPNIWFLIVWSVIWCMAVYACLEFLDSKPLAEHAVRCAPSAAGMIQLAPFLVGVAVIVSIIYRSIAKHRNY